MVHFELDVVGAEVLNLDASVQSVLAQAGAKRDGRFLALADDRDSGVIDALRHEIAPHGAGPPTTECQVVGGAATRVRVAEQRDPDLGHLEQQRGDAVEHGRAR